MVWWSIPAIATLAAWAYTRLAGSWGRAVRPRPQPGSPEDRADLARFAEGLRAPTPGSRT